MLPIRNLSGDTRLVNNINQLKRTRKVNGEKTLSFLAVPDNSQSEAWEYVQNESIVIFDGLEYIIKGNQEKSVSNRSIRQVQCVQTFFNTMINCFQYEQFSGSQTFFAALTRVFEPTPFTFSIIDSFTAETFENFGRDNCLSLFQNVLNRYGAEFELIGTTIYLKRQIGIKAGFQMRWKYNITAISKDIDTKNLATVIRGFGGEYDEETGTYPVEREYRSNDDVFGELHAEPVYDERITTVEGMDARLLRELVDEPQLSITVDIAEIRDVHGNPLEVINEGDSGFIIYEPMNITVEARVVEIDEEFKLVSGKWVKVKTNVTLSNIKEKLTDKTTRFAQTTKKVDRLFEGKEGLPYNVLPEAVRIAAEAINNSLTEIEYPPGQGQVLRDPLDPNKLVRLTSAGIGLSDDGGATYRTAMTGAGIVTNELVAGIIRTNNIQIVGEDDLFFWDGEGLYAYNPSDLTKYVSLNSSGLYVAKGAITIERPDGFSLVNNGLANFDLDVQGGIPQYIDNAKNPDGTYKVTTDGPYTSTASTDYVRFDYFRFRHTARFLSLAFYGRGGGAGAFVYVRIVDENGYTLAVQNTNLLGDTPLGITLDLGIPNGSTRLLYAEFRTTSEDYPARLRLATRYMTG